MLRFWQWSPRGAERKAAVRTQTGPAFQIGTSSNSQQLSTLAQSSSLDVGLTSPSQTRGTISPRGRVQLSLGERGRYRPCYGISRVISKAENKSSSSMR